MSANFPNTDQWVANFLKATRARAKGKLADSINMTLNENTYDLEVEAADYLPYVDLGVNGSQQNNGSPYSYKSKKPPISALSPWANSKKINPWALQKSIYKKGTKPQNILQKPFDKEYKGFADALAEDLANQLEDKIKKQLK